MRKSKGVAVINSTVFVLAAVICYAFFTAQVYCQQLININFTADKNSGYVIKTGPAAIGFATNDFWNVYSRDVDNEWDWRSAGTVTNLIWADGAASRVNVSVTNAAGCWANGVPDPMYNTYLYPASGNITVTLTGLPAGHYAFYLYGHGVTYNQNSLFELKSGANNYGTLGTTTDSNWNSPIWVPGRQFVIYPLVVVEANRSVDITVKPGQYGLPFINGLQIELLSDGIPSSWRQQYFGSEALTERSSAIADPDGDGASNYQEYLAGTDPLDPNSVKPQVSLLTITPTTEWFVDSVTVTLATTVLNGVIRYTQDGMAPTVFSPAYTNAFRLFESTPVKARVFLNGYPVSETASAQFTRIYDVLHLININFSADKNSGYVVKTGPAAVGFTANDFWNVYSRDVDNEWDWRSAGTVTNLIWADGATSRVSVSVTNAAGYWANGVPDPMYNSYLYPSGGNITATLTGLPAGHYAFYLYGHGAANNQNSLFEVRSGANNYGTLGTTTDSTWNSPVWAVGRQYVIFPLVGVATNQSVDITVKPGHYGLPFINGMQIELLSDGITSSWRQQYFGSEALTERSSAIADPDGDGASNYQEFLAGTDPLDPNSVKPQVSLLTITPTKEWFTNSVTVTLATTVSNGVIRYTQDGTAPTVFSPAYTNAFRLFESTPVKARVFVNGYPVSETASAQFSRIYAIQQLININFTADKNSEYVVKTGPAAVGFTTNDFWNVYSRDLDTQYNWRSAGTVTNLIWAKGAASQVKVSVTNAAGYWANGVPDPMYNTYLYPSSGNITATLTGLPAGHYAFYLYGHGAANNQNSLFEVRSGANNYGTLGTTTDSTWNSPVWAAGRQFVIYPLVVVATNQSVIITVKPGKYGLPFINGMQIELLSDGIPMSWRQLFFGSAVVDERSSANADPDGDGANNLEEYLAGTNPLDPQSVLKILSIHTVPVVTWNSVSNVVYFILRKNDMDSTNWTAVVPVQANGSITTFTDYTATNNKAFYWITPKP